MVSPLIDVAWVMHVPHLTYNLSINTKMLGYPRPIWDSNEWIVDSIISKGWFLVATPLSQYAIAICQMCLAMNFVRIFEDTL